MSNTPAFSSVRHWHFYFFNLQRLEFSVGATKPQETLQKSLIQSLATGVFSLFPIFFFFQTESKTDNPHVDRYN